MCDYLLVEIICTPHKAKFIVHTSFHEKRGLCDMLNSVFPVKADNGDKISPRIDTSEPDGTVLEVAVIIFSIIWREKQSENVLYNGQ